MKQGIRRKAPHSEPPKPEMLPEKLAARLAAYSVGPENVRLFLSLDLRRNFTFGEVWIAVTDTAVFYFDEDQSCVYSRTEYGLLASENLPTSGLLTIVYKPANIRKVLARYSMAKAGETAAFLKLFSILEEKGQISPEDRKRIRPERARPAERERKPGRFGPPEGPPPGGPFHGPKDGKPFSRKKVIRRLLSYSRQYWVRIAVVVLLILLASAMQIIYPYLSGKLYMDEVLNPTGRYYGMVAQLVLAMIAVQGATLFLNAVSGRFNAKFAADVIYRLKTDTFRSMQKLSMKFFTDRETGNLMTRINNDSEEVQWFFIDGLPYMLFHLANMAGVIALILIMSPYVSLFVLIPVPFILLFMRKVMPKFHRMFQRSHRRRSDMNTAMNDSFTGVKVVKAFGKEEQEIANFDSISRHFADTEKKIGQTAETLFPTTHLLMWIGSLGIYIFGGIQILRGHILFGDLTAMLSYVGLLYNPLRWFTRLISSFSRALQAANRVFEVMDAVPQVAESAHPVSLSDVKGDVRLEQVCFGYEPNVPILTDISIHVKPGEFIGVVGPSGVGKSTLINLITRLYDVDSGVIYIDDVPVKEIAFDDLHKHIAMVLQDTYLFMGTVADNIAYARPTASREEIMAAAKKACAHDFIMNLPDGYDTAIGGGGQELSGGERQRLALARAILTDPSILILDEATSAVDTKTEMDIQHAMEAFAKGRTTFHIAHRLSTLRNADRLVVLEGGKVAECGTHEELLRIENGVYRRLYTIQKEALKVRGIEG